MSGYRKLEDVPIHKCVSDLLSDINRLCNDKRGHALKDNHIEWLEYKFRTIKKVIRKNKHLKEGTKCQKQLKN